MTVPVLKRSFIQRLLGRCATAEPADPGCWSVVGGRVTLDPARAPELAHPGGAVRLEGHGLARRVLVVHGEDGRYHAFPNVCTHGKRRLDPVPGAGMVQCCSVGKSTFDYEGKLLAGSAKGPLMPLVVTETEGRLLIDVTAAGDPS